MPQAHEFCGKEKIQIFVEMRFGLDSLSRKIHKYGKQRAGSKRIIFGVRSCIGI